jgi:hypothetical protein
METNQTGFSNKNKIDNFIYFNTFGVLFKDKLILNNNNKNIKVNLIDIKRAVIQKKRNFRWNIFILCVLILLLGNFFYFQKQTTLNDKIAAIALSIIVSFSFFFIKETKYKLIVLLNENKIEIKVKKQDKEQAKLLMSKINRIIKETKHQKQIA